MRVALNWFFGVIAISASAVTLVLDVELRELVNVLHRGLKAFDIELVVDREWSGTLRSWKD